MITLHRLLGPMVALFAAAALAQAQTPATHASSAPAQAHPSKPPQASARQLDLKAPPLNHIYSSSQLRYMMTYDPDDSSDTEVSVKGVRAPMNVPVTPGNQLLAVPWALLHPLQAWRVLTPVESP
ncbi:MAG TPA: hypothetical protein VGV09_03580 [Steroidobacteraceae bacterium]|nr:hypothetical protein [Steroidobacteraceae bacterium]